MDDRCGAASDADSVRSLIAEAPIVAFTLDLDGIFTAVEGGGLAAVGMDIRQALHHLGGITGEITKDEIPSGMYGTFCIGI